ncbi:MAG: hypothetical protein QOG35_1620 [Solirubrobacteraceae bacterium]|jgi:DNA-binding XRE family transcriptional regulator|nr:hypothetical protein [Solirubrobacteraceae bacterium]
MARKYKTLSDDLNRRLDEHPNGDSIRGRAQGELDAELQAHALSLGMLRKAHGLTQVQLARELGVSQAQVSRVETQTDLYLSTLASYIQAMGGELRIIGVFGETTVPISIAEVSDPAGAETIAGATIHIVE